VEVAGGLRCNMESHCIKVRYRGWSVMVLREGICGWEVEEKGGIGLEGEERSDISGPR